MWVTTVIITFTSCRLKQTQYAFDSNLPAPGVLSITGEWAELVIGIGVVKVIVVGVVEHGFDALSETYIGLCGL